MRRAQSLKTREPNLTPPALKGPRPPSLPAAPSPPRRAAARRIPRNSAPVPTVGPAATLCHGVVCQWVTTIDDFLALESTWRDLETDCAVPVPFAAWEWVSAWLKHFVIGTEPVCTPEFNGALRRRSAANMWAIAVVRGTDGRVIGLAPLHLVPWMPMNIQRLQLKSARPFGELGRYVETLTEGPVTLLRRGSEVAAVDAIVAALNQQPWKGCWQVLSLSMFDYSSGHRRASIDGAAANGGDRPAIRGPRPSPFTAATDKSDNVDRGGPCRIGPLLQPAPRLGLSLWRSWSPCVIRLRYASLIESQVVSLPATWEAYRSTLSKSMRDNLSYYPRKMKKHGLDWKILQVSGAADFIAGVGTLVDLHQCRSKGPRGPAHTNHLPLPVHRAFLTEALCALAERGAARIYLAEVDEAPVAGMAVLEFGNVATFYYSGFEPAWYDYSPLLLLTAAALKGAIERGLTLADFLPTAAQWKTRWGAQPGRATIDMRYVNLGPLSWAGRCLSILRRFPASASGPDTGRPSQAAQ